MKTITLQLVGIESAVFEEIITKGAASKRFRIHPKRNDTIVMGRLRRRHRKMLREEAEQVELKIKHDPLGDQGSEPGSCIRIIVRKDLHRPLYSFISTEEGIPELHVKTVDSSKTVTVMKALMPVIHKLFTTVESCS